MDIVEAGVGSGLLSLGFELVLPEQAQNGLWQLVGLGQDGCASLLHDLLLAQVGSSMLSTV